MTRAPPNAPTACCTWIKGSLSKRPARSAAAPRSRRRRRRRSRRSKYLVSPRVLASARTCSWRNGLDNEAATMQYFLPLYPIVRRLEELVGPKAATLIVIAGALGVVLVILLLARLLFANYTMFVLKTMRRNFLRTALACLAVMVLTFVVTLVWSFLVP